MSFKSLFILAVCSLMFLVFSTKIAIGSEEILPPELDNEVFKNACLQCHVFSGEYFGDYPRKRKGSIFGEKVGEDAKFGFTTRRNGMDLASPKRQKYATLLSVEAFVKLIDKNMMVPITEKEKVSTKVAAKIYRDYAWMNLN